MIKAIFFDVDGTLVSFKTHTIPQSTIEALKVLKKRGIKTFIATGRAFAQINNLGDLKFDGYITLNGSCCLSGDSKVIYKNSIPAEDIKSLVDYQQTQKEFACGFVTPDEIFMSNPNSKVNEIENLLDIKFELVKELTYALDKEILQLIAFFEENQEDKIMKEILPNCSSTRWNSLFADVIAKGNSKQVGISKILEFYDIHLSETISFGDGGNDIPMLQYTDISVAMGNASDEVKKHATHITDSVDDDGIWNALKKFGLV